MEYWVIGRFAPNSQFHPHEPINCYVPTTTDGRPPSIDPCVCYSNYYFSAVPGHPNGRGGNGVPAMEKERGVSGLKCKQTLWVWAQIGTYLWESHSEGNERNGLIYSKVRKENDSIPSSSLFKPFLTVLPFPVKKSFSCILPIDCDLFIWELVPFKRPPTPSTSSSPYCTRRHTQCTLSGKLDGFYSAL